MLLGGARGEDELGATPHDHPHRAEDLGPKGCRVAEGLCPLDQQ